MRRITTICLLASFALAGCEKPELVRYPGEPASSPGNVLNTAPSVSAGADATLQWPSNSLTLAGSASDDGQPAALKYTWTSTPGGVQFAQSNTAQTTATFAAPGSYTLTLTVDDGALQSSDSLVVTVKPVGANAAPIVNAGADVSIEQPLSATLDATVSDDGVPASTLTSMWSRLTGPGDVTFADPAAVDTSATFSAVGTYELQLSVSDGELTSLDTILVTVGPAVYPAADLDELDPDRGWRRATPEDVGMTSAPLLEAQAYAQQAGGNGLISRHGRIVHSWGNIDARIDVKSTTKSIGGTALAFALDDGRVRVDDIAATHIASFGTPPLTNDPAQTQAITLLQLATHTSGFEKTGAFGRIIDAPGTVWRYSDGGLNWLADTLTAVYGQDLEQLFMTRLYPVLGINERDDIQWRDQINGMRPDPRVPNVEHREFAAGMVVNVNTMARVGLLYLRRGEWSGGQRVFSAAYADLVRTPRAESATVTVAEPLDFPEANRRYGVLWWTNATGALPNVPRDAYWAWGLGDSLIVVIPSLDLVIARAGVTQPASPGVRVFGDNDWNADYAVLAPFLDPIVRSVQR